MTRPVLSNGRQAFSSVFFWPFTFLGSCLSLTKFRERAGHYPPKEGTSHFNKIYHPRPKKNQMSAAPLDLFVHPISLGFSSALEISFGFKLFKFHYVAFTFLSFACPHLSFTAIFFAHVPIRRCSTKEKSKPRFEQNLIRSRAQYHMAGGTNIEQFFMMIAQTKKGPTDLLKRTHTTSCLAE